MMMLTAAERLRIKLGAGQAVKPCPRCGQALVDTGDGIWCHAIGTKDCEWRQQR